MHVVHMPAWYSLDPGSHKGMFVTEIARSTKTVGVRSDILFAAQAPRFVPRFGQRVRADISEYWFEAFAPPGMRPINRWTHHNYRAGFKKYIEQQGLPDLLHVHGYAAVPYALSAARIARVPVVMTAHSTRLLGDIPRWHRYIFKAKMPLLSAIIAVSQPVANTIHHLVPNAKCRVVPNAVDTDVFEPGKPGQKSQILCIGSLDARKNQQLLVRAFALVLKELPGLQLTLIGGGPLRSALEKLCAQLGIVEKVMFLGELPHEDVARQIRLSGVVVSSSNLETFGATIIEAIASGVPVVCAANAGSEELFEDKIGIYVKVPTPQNFAQAICAVMSDQVTFEGAKLRRVAIEKYGLRPVGQQYLHLYERCVKREASN